MSVINFLQNEALADNRVQLVDMLRTLSQQRSEVQSALDACEQSQLTEPDEELSGRIEEMRQTLKGMLREYTNAVTAITTVAQCYAQKASVKTRIQAGIATHEAAKVK